MEKTERKSLLTRPEKRVPKRNKSDCCVTWKSCRKGDQVLWCVFIKNPKVRHRSKSQHALFFRFSQETMQHSVTEAHLWLWVKGGNGSLTVDVYRMRRGFEGGVDVAPATPLDSRSNHTRPSGRGGWITIDVRRLLDDWFRRPRDYLGIIIRATDAARRNVPIVVKESLEESGDSSGQPSLAPFVEVHTTDFRRRRPKRMTSLTCDESSEETRCCRYPLTVDFEEFGWDFIIAPKKYEANYCAGECPHIFLQRYPHTHLVHIANPSGNRGPCCGPRKMSPISMLYFDQDYNIILGLLHGMVVDRCGCA